MPEFRAPFVNQPNKDKCCYYCSRVATNCGPVNCSISHMAVLDEDIVDLRHRESGEYVSEVQQGDDSKKDPSHFVQFNWFAGAFFQIFFHDFENKYKL